MVLEGDVVIHEIIDTFLVFGSILYKVSDHFLSLLLRDIFLRFPSGKEGKKQRLLLFFRERFPFREFLPSSGYLSSIGIGIFYGVFIGFE